MHIHNTIVIILGNFQPQNFLFDQVTRKLIAPDNQVVVVQLLNCV